VSVIVGLSRTGALELDEHSEWVGLSLKATDYVGSHFWLPLADGDERRAGYGTCRLTTSVVLTVALRSHERPR
jgi:hypothetical protein